MSEADAPPKEPTTEERKHLNESQRLDIERQKEERRRSQAGLPPSGGGIGAFFGQHKLIIIGVVVAGIALYFYLKNASAGTGSNQYPNFSGYVPVNTNQAPSPGSPTPGPPTPNPPTWQNWKPGDNPLIASGQGPSLYPNLYQSGTTVLYQGQIFTLGAGSGGNVWAVPGVFDFNNQSQFQQWQNTTIGGGKILFYGPQSAYH